jgi:hypothetical protein
MWRSALFLTCIIFLSSCALPSPYSAAGIPDLPEVEVTRSAEGELRLFTSPGLSPKCRRDAIFLKAAKITLENSSSHFQIVGETKTQYSSINANELQEPVTIKLCGGVCPGMFSASGIAHILVPKFSPAAASMFSEQKPAKCPENG